MKPLLILLAGLLVAVDAFAAGTVDFTPQPSAVKFEGAVRRIVRFRCLAAVPGRETIDYSPPWPITGSGDLATMMIPDTDATAALRRVRTPAPLDFEDQEQIVAWAKDYLSEYADGLQFDSVEQDPLVIDGQPTVELTARYTLFGRPVAHSLLLCRRAVSRETELFVFELQAKPADFVRLHRVFVRSLYGLVGF